MNVARTLLAATALLVLAGCVVSGGADTAGYRSHGHYHGHPYGWHRGYYPRSWYHDRGYGWHDRHPRFRHRHRYGGWYQRW